MAGKWNLMDVLERVANQKTQPPEASERVVTMPGLDKLARAIRELQAEIVGLDGEEHKVMLAFQEVERESETMQADIRGKRNDVRERLARLQGQMIEAVKACGIMASLPGGTDDPR